MGENKSINCKNCVRFPSCKFVEKNKEFAKQMYGIFEHLEWNNLEQIFYDNANKCKFFVDDEIKVDNLLKKIETAKYQMNWLYDYVRGSNEPSFIIDRLKEITEDYKKSLDK